jgi:hypothetical protein
LIGGQVGRLVRIGVRDRDWYIGHDRTRRICYGAEQRSSCSCLGRAYESRSQQE